MSKEKEVFDKEAGEVEDSDVVRWSNFRSFHTDISQDRFDERLGHG